jgi:hypothetical protein
MAKNRFIEALRERAKIYKKTKAFKCTRSWDHKLGIKVYHLYTGDGARDKGWWDDTAFIMGSQQVTVGWVHPRYRYQNICDDKAWEDTKEQYPRREGDFFEGSTPNYRYLGKNKKRKKIVSWTMKPTSQEFRDYYEILDAKKKEIQQTGDLVATCDFKVSQLGYCRWVDVCYPIEVLNEQSLKELADFVRECIQNPGSFERTWGEYKYTREDWNREFPEG